MRINIFCKPSSDYLLNPGACLITGITPQHCPEHGLPECRFAEAIYAAKCQRGTISACYNSMKFDSEFTRFLFWRNLLDSYCQEWQNHCGRWALMPVGNAVYADLGEEMGLKRQLMFRHTRLHFIPV